MNIVGPYDGSYTWFEAVIVRQLQLGTSVNAEEQARLIIEALERRRHRESNEQDATGETICQTLQLSVPRPWLFGFIQKTEPTPCNLITVKNFHDGSDMWTIQTNPRAEFNASQHEVVWSKNDASVSAEDEERGHSLTGRKSGGGFIAALQPGDRVAVLARAQVRLPCFLLVAQSQKRICSIHNGQILSRLSRCKYILLCNTHREYTLGERALKS